MREKGPATLVTLSGSLELPADCKHTRDPGPGRQRTAWLSPACDSDSCSRPEKLVHCSRQGKMDLFSSSNCSALNPSRHPISGVSGSPLSLIDCRQSLSPRIVSLENDDVWPRHPRRHALVHCPSGVHGQPLTVSLQHLLGLPQGHPAGAGPILRVPFPGAHAHHGIPGAVLRACRREEGAGGRPVGRVDSTAWRTTKGLYGGSGLPRRSQDDSLAQCWHFQGLEHTSHNPGAEFQAAGDPRL